MSLNFNAPVSFNAPLYLFNGQAIFTPQALVPPMTVALAHSGVLGVQMAHDGTNSLSGGTGLTQVDLTDDGSTVAQIMES